MTRVIFSAIISIVLENACCMFHYNTFYQHFKEACQSSMGDARYDEDSEWKLLKENNSGSLSEENLQKGDLTDEQIEALESESSYDRKIEAFEKAFFGNEILYKKFRELVQLDSELTGLIEVRSEFFRWLIQNKRGDYETAKPLIKLYQSLGNHNMYLLWKSIGMSLKLPVERS